MIRILAIFVALLGACQGTTVVMAPYNTSVVLGGSATLACILSEITDSITWKKLTTTNAGTITTTISLNNNLLITGSKYSIAGTYNLTISSIIADDLGQYQCAVGATNYDAYLQSVVLPNNVSVYWENSPRAGNTVNLTCKATYGNPPPFLRWYKDNVDFTHSAYYYTQNTLSSGYGDAMSTVAIALVSTDQNKLYRCSAEFDGWYNVMEYTLQTQLSGSSAIQAQSILAALLVAVTVVLRSM